MEFLSPQQKKKRAHKLYLGYMLLGVLVLLATYVLISSARGYDLLSTKGDVIQNGLLFIDSRPNGADIYVNGAKESNGTNAKLSLPDNTYDIVLKKQGYRDWSAKVGLIGGTVEFLTYPRLLPSITTLVKTDAITSPQLSATLQSRDKQMLSLVDQSTPNQVKIYDLSSPAVAPSAVSISEDSVGGKPIKSVELVEWAGDNLHFLTRVFTADGQYVYVIMAKDNSGPQNISQLFTLSGAERVGFWDGKWDRLYIHTPGGGVLLANTKDKSVSAQSLVSEPIAEIYPFGGGKFAYVTTVGTETMLKFYSESKVYTVLTVPDQKQPLLVKNFGYNRNDYIAVAGGGLDKSYVFKNFEQAIKKSTSGRVGAFLLDPIASKTLDVSRGGRFVLFADQDHISTYDIEQKLLSRFNIGSTKPSQLGWYDDTRLFELGSDSKLQILDFDGANIYDIASSVASLPYQNADVSLSTFVSKSDTGALTLTTLDIKTAK
jgi:hypothetical protein